MRYELSDYEWTAIKPMLPNKPRESFDPERMQRSEDIADYTLGTPRTRFERYINKFLFLPPEEAGTTLARLEAALTKPAGLMPEDPKVSGNEERSERCGLISL